MAARYAASPITTLLLAALLVGYLIIGKCSIVSLQPRVLMVLAALAIVHGSWVILSRLRLLAQQTIPDVGVRTSRYAAVLDITMLMGLLIVLALGLTNYLLGFQGYLEIIPGGEEMRLGANLQLLEQGALSKPGDHAEIITGSKMDDQGQTLLLQVRSGEKAEALVLKVGKPQSHWGLRLAYQGEAHRVVLSVQRGNHDYLAAPVTLRRMPGDRLYRARLDMTEPGASGEVTFDPDTGIMAAVIQNNGVKEFAGTLQPGQVVTQGEMRLQVTATSHLGRILVQHRSYRAETLAALGLFLVAGLARLALGRTGKPMSS